jgi:hypothetical protein
MARAPKVALDFLLRPATMTSRQHSGTKLYTFWYQALYKTGKTRSATATPLLRGRVCDMSVRTMRRLQCLLWEDFTLYRAAIATDSGRAGTPANNRRDKLLRTRQRAHALKHGDAIV